MNSSEKTRLLGDGEKTCAVADKEAFKNNSEEEAPFVKANFFTILMSSWVGDLLKKVKSNRFQEKRDIWACPARDKAEINSSRLMKLWQTEVDAVGEHRASLTKVIFKSEKKAMCTILAASFASALIGFLTPSLCVNYLLQYANGPRDDVRNGLFAAGLFAVCYLVSQCLQSYTSCLLQFLAPRLRSSLMGLLYRKLLRMRHLSEKETGMLVNVIVNETGRIIRLHWMSYLLMAPFTILAALVFTAVVLSPVVLLAYTTVLIGAVVTTIKGNYLKTFRRQTALQDDKRMQITHEVLSNMKIVKTFAWEKFVFEQIIDERNKQLKLLGRFQFVSTCLRVILISLEVTVKVSVVLTLLLWTGAIHTVEVYTSLAVISLFTVIFSVVTPGIRTVTDLAVAVKRIKNVLTMEELPPPASLPYTDRGEYSVVFNKTSFAHFSSPATMPGTESRDEDINWDVTTPVLPKLHFSVKRGRLVGVCGPVGSGKSSLFMAMLGRMVKLSGCFAVEGRMALVPQSPWVFNASLRQNIVFHSQFDHLRYQKVLSDCCLLEDLANLPEGDETEIGERGTTLSGGQKQRVSLARAVYSNSDVYLLDDPLSSVDTKVALDIFNFCIQGALRDKTVFLVTHQLQYLCHCDNVLFLTSTSMPVFSTHRELIRTNPQYQDLISSVDSDSDSDNVPSVDEGTNQTGVQEDTKQIHTDKGHSSGLMAEETILPGAVRVKSVASYLRTVGSWPMVLAVCMCTAVSSLYIYSPLWLLTLWFESDTSTVNCSSNCQTISFPSSEGNGFFIAFALLPLFGKLCVLLEGLAYASVSVRASSSIHKQLLTKVMECGMDFFITTPIGRLQNYFSADLDQVDSDVPLFLRITLSATVQILAASVTVITSYAYLIIVIPVVLLFVALISREAIHAMTLLQRIQKAQKSDLCGWVTSTLQGLHTIVVFDKQDHYKDKFFELLDHFCVTDVCVWNCQHWATVRVTLLTVTLTSLVAVFIVIPESAQTASLAGEALTVSLQCFRLFQVVLTLACNFLPVFISLEKIQAFTTSAPREADDPRCQFVPPSSWPFRGNIAFSDVCLRYRPELPLSLDHVTFTVDAGERIGIVGRTGAGKSSLMTTLMRLTSIEGGSIVIDGLDVCSIDRHHLRSKMAVIPQDPVLFTGTIRSNIDPFNERTDSEVVEILKGCHLHDKVTSMWQRVENGGSNLSMGERQLLCVARAVNRRSKIVLIDEATASVDPQTDELTQATLTRLFAGCTVLVIAHRLNTILHCDKILVMDAGRVVEFDTVSKLLQYDSHFNRLLNAANSKR